MAEKENKKSRQIQADGSLANKMTTTFYLSKESLVKLEGLVALTGKNRSELVRDAIDRYFGEITSGMNQSYLCDTYGTEIKAAIERSEAAIRRNEYRTAVELNMLAQLIAGEQDLTKEQYDALRSAARKAVDKTRGE